MMRSPESTLTGAADGEGAMGAASAFASGILGASALGAGFALASSPSPAIVAITVPTFTPSVPSAIMIAVTTPSSTASNSIVALSVSISAIRSPDLTASPTFTSHLASVPSSIVGDKAGILSSMGIGRFTCSCECSK